MDFGAVICKPSPNCSHCVFKKYCYAFMNNKTTKLPARQKKVIVKRRWFYYFVFKRDNKIAIRQRNGRDIWQQLYEFPMIEAKQEQNLNWIMRNAEKNSLVEKGGYEVISVSPIYKQQLSHQLIAGQFITITSKESFETTKDPIGIGCLWLTKNQLKKYAFPKFINSYLSKEIIETE